MTVAPSPTPFSRCWRCLSWLAIMLLGTVSLRADEVRLIADFSVRTGAIRRFHGINKGPLAPGGLFDVIKEQKELGVPFTRLHDCGWPNPYVVDHHVAFPDPEADLTLAQSYDFRLTDEYIEAVRMTGAEPIYRLGESIEHTSVKRFVHPPANMEKWAAVCLGIIRHYNEGWAIRFQHHIRHWEIWNEPENRPVMWSGTDNDYLRLYRTAATAIKKQFLDLKVAGLSRPYHAILPRCFRQLARYRLMTDSNVPPPLPSEQLLIDTLDRAEFQRCIVVSPGRGQSGWHASALCPAGEVILWYVDSFRAAQAKAAAIQAKVSVEVVCSADLPPSPVQLALVPVLQRGEAEMTRDVLQQAHERLEVGGKMITSVNNSRDHWLQRQMQDLFDKVKCHQTSAGWVYTAIKRQPLRKLRNFAAEFVFRDDQRLVRMITRPSVFSHRSLDVAARLLIQHSGIQPGDRVLDYGCGCGAVAIASALRSVTGQVVAVDCNARSVECAERSAALNGLTNVTAILSHDGELPTDFQYDLALLNPPYYGNFSIAIHFMRTAAEQVRDGGRVIVVTKNRQQYHDQEWPHLQLESEMETSGYQLLTYRKRKFDHSRDCGLRERS